MQQKMRKTLVILALLGAALFNYPRPGRGGTASGAYSQAAMNAYGGRATAYPEYEETSRDKASEPTDAEKNLAACTFFGFEANCEQDRSALKTFLRQWAIDNHPDKVPDEMKAKQTEISNSGLMHSQQLKSYMRKQASANLSTDDVHEHTHAANNTAEDARQEDIKEERVPPTNSTAPA